MLIAKPCISSCISVCVTSLGTSTCCCLLLHISSCYILAGPPGVVLVICPENSFSFDFIVTFLLASLVESLIINWCAQTQCRKVVKGGQKLNAYNEERCCNGTSPRDSFTRSAVFLAPLLFVIVLYTVPCQMATVKYYFYWYSYVRVRVTLAPLLFVTMFYTVPCQMTTVENYSGCYLFCRIRVRPLFLEVKWGKEVKSLYNVYSYLYFWDTPLKKCSPPTCTNQVFPVDQKNIPVTIDE